MLYSIWRGDIKYDDRVRNPERLSLVRGFRIMVRIASQSSFTNEYYMFTLSFFCPG